VGLHVGGWIQGMMMNNPDLPFMDSVIATVPWLYSRSVSGFLLTIGHIAFALNFFWMLFPRRGAATSGPTMLEGKGVNA
ncbi:hypothetical protein RZS08_38885, partial [Arthrospira platensis SPKY1]|nr:hypothetical protein [Arthrospira platensis SPKY1]